MLKIQEITIDGDVFKLREPRIADYRAAKGKDDDAFMIAMLSGMLLDNDENPVGEEAVLGLPLRVLGRLTEAVDLLINGPKVPLDPKIDSSTA